MKYIVNYILNPIILVVLLVTVANAQAPYPSTVTLNYVREWSPTSPITDETIVPTRPIEEVKMTTSYVDGLGRPLQTVSKQISPTKKDMVATTFYDAFGRETQKYLPSPSTQTSAGTEITDNGSFKLNPFQQQQAFMSNQFGSQNETYFYSQTDFEASPLNRPVKSFAPGNSWVGSKGTASEKAVQMQYQINTVADAVRIWNIATTQGSVPTTSANFDAGQLYKNITIDEKNNQVVEFKDKEGKVILKRVQADNAVTDGHSGWLCTYYIYDDFGQLRFVIPPKATELFLQGTAISTFANELCFRYEYDQRNRMIIKKVPGAAEVFMVYDQRDRLIMTQDGNLRNLGQWLVTQYENNLNRPIKTGLLADAATPFNTHLNNAYSSINYLSTASLDMLTQNFYDDYTWVANTGTALGATIDATNLTNSNYFFTNYNASPNFALPLTADYATKGMSTGSMIKVLGSNPAKYLYTVIFYDEKGRPIQTQSINNSGGKDVNTTQYDFSGKPLRSLLQHNYGSGGMQTYTILTKMDYDHAGRLLNARKAVSGTVNGQTISVPEKPIVQNSYDELGQLKTKNIGNKPNRVNPLETLSYDYNIRGWLLGMNRGFISSTNATNYFGFELAYDKTNAAAGNGYAAPQFNGNIAGTIWKSKGDAVNRQYDFGYDNVNRLLRADFKQDNSGSTWDNSKVDFSVIMGDGSSDYKQAYDANGNIKQMQQWGLKINIKAQIDNLNYTYYANSNKLQQVTDGYNDKDSKLGDFKYDPTTKTAADYGYDVNGNLITDRNKNLIGSSSAVGIDQSSTGAAINYNYLNLPQQINVNTKGTINYTYDAAGNKLQKITNEPSGTVTYNSILYSNVNITTTTDYIAGFIYETKTYSDPIVNAGLGYSGKLQFFGQEEGRIRALYKNDASPNTLTGFAFDYMIKDHLGNVRMVLTDEGQQDIYPAATLEDNALVTENKFYNIASGNIQPVPTSVASSNQSYANNNGISNPGNPTPTAQSVKMYKLNSSTNNGADKTGLGITLKVMAGDRLDVFGKSYYTGAVPQPPVNSNVPIVDLLNGFLSNQNGIGIVGAHGAISATTIIPPTPTGSIYDLFSSQNNQSAAAQSKPKAFINVVFFNEQFKAVDFRVSMVGDNGTLKDHYQDLQNLVAQYSGFVYIYCSNETDVDVFFDNLQVVHTRSPILEETHYYPFGLTMAGISSTAENITPNKKKYNSIEYDTDFDINACEAQLRDLDAQTGRWWQVDPKTDEMYMWSTYASNFDNPIRYQDPLGNEPNENCCGEWLGKVWGGIKKRVSEYTSKEGLISLTFPVASLSKSLVEDPKGTVNSLVKTLYNGSVVGTVNNTVNSPKEFGKTLVDGAVLVAAEKIPDVVTGAKNTITGNVKSGLGDLTKAEVKGIQKVVNEAERPIEVVGSAAQGTRRGVGTNNPIGKGSGTRSDIDYVAPPSSIPYYIQNNLPGIDPKTGIIPGYANPFQSPFIRFEPNAKPTVTPKQ